MFDMFNALAPAPPGHKPVTWYQVQLADRALFTYIAEHCRGTAKPATGATVTAFEEHWKNGMFDFDVRATCRSLPGPSSSASARSGDLTKTDQPTDEMKRLRNQLKNSQDQLAAVKRKLDTSKGAKGGGKGTGKGNKGDKGNKKPKNTPGFMKGLDLSLPNNEPICWNYNSVNGCSNAVPGENCNRGWHVCAKPQCRGKMAPHSATTH